MDHNIKSLERDWGQTMIITLINFKQKNADG